MNTDMRGRMAALALGMALLTPGLAAVAAGEADQAASPPSPAPQTDATYQNPVLDHGFADPAILRAGDGTYYAYSTQDDENLKTNLRMAMSKDLVNWKLLPDGMPQPPAWSARKPDLWAPDISQHGDTFYLYFTSNCDTNQGKCIGVAIAKDPQGPFIATDEPLVCGPSFINIDPMAFDDPATGKKLLYWGSGFKAIRVQELADDRTHFKAGSQPMDLIQPLKEHDTYQHLVEAAYVIQRGGYYYLFFSGDNCCGARAHYAVMIARSRSALGPFETLAEATHSAESTILEQKNYWRAPGHNSIATDDAGQDWIVYHAINPQSPTVVSPLGKKSDRRILLIDRIIYTNGWPSIAGGEPSFTPQPRPVIRPR